MNDPAASGRGIKKHNKLHGLRKKAGTDDSEMSPKEFRKKPIHNSLFSLDSH